MNVKLLFATVLLLLTMSIAYADVVSVSYIGYHTDSQKEALIYAQDPVVYLHSQTDVVQLNPVLTKCQGNISCYVVDFTDASKGEYFISSPNANSSNFTVSDDIYNTTIPLFLDWFNFHMNQNSSFHADYFADIPLYDTLPPFTITADGAMLMHANMAAITLSRLTSAYLVNPSVFDIDEYDVTAQNTNDIYEYIESYTEYLRNLQRYNGKTNEYTVVRGWGTNWGQQNPNAPHIEWFPDTNPSWLGFTRETAQEFDVATAYAFANTVPIMNQYDSDGTQELLNHTISMMEFYESYYPTWEETYVGYVGATYFRLYDLTGNWTYIQKAVELDVPITLVSDNTRGNEFYWDEFVKHKDIIEQLGLDFNNADQVFSGKIYFDFKDRGPLSMNNTADHVYQLDPNIQFSNARYVLLESVYASKANLQSPQDIYLPLATSQIEWLTGKNAVQNKESNNELESISFILGINNENPIVHSRMSNTQQGYTYLTGDKYIPGWINGPFDYTTDIDTIMNYRSNDGFWKMTETTNEVVSLAMEAIALLDKQMNNRDSFVITQIVNQSTPLPEIVIEEQPQEAVCSIPLANVPATCNGGDIIMDEDQGCRVIACQSGLTDSLYVMACEKDDHFEMYKQSSFGNLEICLGDTCISSSGYAKSLPYCEVPDGEYVCTEKILDQEVTCSGTVTFGIEQPVSQTIGTPFGGVAHVIPGTIEAEDYDVDGFSDLETAQVGDSDYRNDAVDLGLNPFGINVGWIRTGEYFSYTINVSEHGLYDMRFHVSRGVSGNGLFHIERDGVDISGPITFPTTNSWDIYTTVTAQDIELGKGVQTLRFVSDENTQDVDKIDFILRESYTISQGCEVVTCSDSLSSMSVLACDSANSYEITTLSGSNHEICFGDICISNGTIAKNYCEFVPLNITINETPVNETPQTPVNETAVCSESLFSLNVTCSGTIDSDEIGGCRTVVCSDDVNTMQVMACEKGNFFEIYQQSGSGLEICFGDTCMTDQGFIKQDYCPVEQPPVNETPTNETQEPETPLEPIGNFDDLNASCNIGEPVKDIAGGCRIIACQEDTNYLEVMACNKGPFFEMYTQVQEGNGLIACLGDTCLDPALTGFVKSGEFTPVEQPPVDETPIEEPELNETVGMVSIAPWFPQGNNYIFVCNVDAPYYDWDFGDGDKQFYGQKDVWHTYSPSGTFNVTCTAGSEYGSLEVTI